VLGHFIEEEGVPTAGISLVRMHTEIIKPPRALWVPFELGRPLGPPDNADFQRRVLLALMSMFEAPDGPRLEDFPEDEPETTDETYVLACPVDFTQTTVEPGETDQLKASFHREMTAMRPWYDMAVARRQRTTVGVSGIDVDKLGDFIYAFMGGTEPDNPRDDLPLAYTLKFAVEDLQSYYIEGVTAQPGQGSVSSKVLTEWFWRETVAGKVLLALKKVCEASKDDAMSQMGGHFLVPMEVVRRQESSPDNH
jgi:hypothetical protein